MLDTKALIAKILTFIDRPAVKTLSYSASMGTIAGGGWKTDITFSFSVPSGYTAMAGKCIHNSGYVIAYSDGWNRGATSVNPRLHNVTSTTATGNVYCYVTCVRNDLL